MAIVIETSNAVHPGWCGDSRVSACATKTVISFFKSQLHSPMLQKDWVWTRLVELNEDGTRTVHVGWHHGRLIFGDPTPWA